MVQSPDMVRGALREMAGYKGIMSWDDQLWPRGKCFQSVEPVQHVLHINHDRKGFEQSKVFVEMRGIRCKHKPACFRLRTRTA